MAKKTKNKATRGQARDPGLEDLEGKHVFVRCVTHYYTGKLTYVGFDTLVLDDAAWVADTGRFAQALGTGALNEVEPYPGRCFLSRAAVVDVSEWKHALPRETK